MAQTSQHSINSVQDLIRQSPILGTLFVMSFLNWWLSLAVHMYLHGDAIDTCPSRDGFVVNSHGDVTPVTESVWVFSLFYTGATLMVTPAIGIAVAARTFKGELRDARPIVRLGIPIVIGVWCLGWYSSIGSSLYRSVEDWQKLRRPNQGAAANVRPASPL